MSNIDPAEAFRRLYPTILTTAHVTEMMRALVESLKDIVTV